MQRTFWETVAPKWDEEIFNTLAEDREGVITSVILKLARNAQTVVDFGCGVGRYLPLLSRHFKEVYALDWAVSCLDRAKVKAKHLDNVEVLRTTPPVLTRLEGACDVTLAVNVAIDPRRLARERALRTAVSLTKKGGWLVIVVPSLESAFYSEAARRFFRPTAKPEFGFQAGRPFGDPGVLAIEDQATKHYVAEEMNLLLRMMDCVPVEFRQVEYSWQVCHARVPRRFKAPRPWDWLVLARHE